MPLYLKFYPVSHAPSNLTRMPLAEFAVRSQWNNPLPNLFYAPESGGTPQSSNGPSEFYYMQSALPKALAQDCDLAGAPFSLVQGAGVIAADTQGVCEAGSCS